MNLQKIRNFLFSCAIFSSSILLAGCSSEPDYRYPAAHGKPGGISMKNFCAKDGRKYGHTVILIDKTTIIDEPRQDFIASQVFTTSFYESFEPYTKFSYIVIDNKSPYNKKFVFSKCRPKAGKTTEYSAEQLKEGIKINEKNEEFENIKYIKQYWAHFNKETKKIKNKIFSSQVKSDWSLIYESIVNVLDNKQLDFGPDYPKRKLIIISDLMQNGQRLSFYNICKTTNAKIPDLCPKFKEITANKDTKGYFDDTTPSAHKNLDIDIIYLNYRGETKYAIDNSLLQLWTDYFATYGYENVSIKRMLDVSHED